MIAIPAIDLREGACVQLVGGRYEEERVRLRDPLAAALGFARAGLRRLHVVDLDAATGRGSNAAVIRALLAEPALEVQVGGGIRSEAEIESLLGAGAAAVVVGTRAIEEPAWLERAAAAYPGRMIVAADARGRRVTTRGWSRESAEDVRDVVERLDPLPLAGVLVTAVHREGRLAGTDLELMRLVAGRRHPLYAAGGIAGLGDLRALAALGAHAAILGMALYAGALDAPALAAEFAP
ncbi:MAG TPA: HisA/HisF-related TIM barrel protein [Candidatus Eisenbacteria bacterium]|jgi:phosphoribosylformimino-5-aminoimidazole carboxamide ribotide isomerase